MLKNVNVYITSLSLSEFLAKIQTIRLSIWMVLIPVVLRLIVTVTSAADAAAVVDRPAAAVEMAMVAAMIVIAEVVDVALVPAADHHDRAEDVDHAIVIVWTVIHATRSAIVSMRENAERRACLTLRRSI